jgi:RNA polymerase sporulation-specific sigma factor
LLFLYKGAEKTAKKDIDIVQKNGIILVRLVIYKRILSLVTEGIKFFMNAKSRREASAVISLIKKAQAGDEAAFSSLFASYEKLINSKSKQYAEGAPSLEEARSEAIDAFLQAVNTYDIDQVSVTFGLYAHICIDHRLISCMRKWKHLNRTVSLETAENAALGADEKSDPSYYVVERERYAELQDKINNVLTESERRVWFALIAGHTAAEIAKILGKDKKSVENTIYRARKKLRATFPEPQ